MNKKTGKIVVKHIYAAQVAGLGVNPARVENQMVGELIMGTSRALHEEVRFNKTQVTSLDWVTYPILRFKDSPKVTTDRRSSVARSAADRWRRAGARRHVPAAIANAFFDATGVRIRQAPMTPARVRATLKAAGVA